MKANVTCEYNTDNGCVEIRIPDEGIMLGIDCTAIENAFAENRFDRLELDYLIYNDPRAYAELVLSGDIDGYLKRVASSNRIHTAS